MSLKNKRLEKEKIRDRTRLSVPSF